jgi:hypothetical protein
LSIVDETDSAQFVEAYGGNIFDYKFDRRRLRIFRGCERFSAKIEREFVLPRRRSLFLFLRRHVVGDRFSGRHRGAAIRRIGRR